METDVQQLQEAPSPVQEVRILVVDDESKIRELYRRLLDRTGYRVVAVGDAMEASSLLVRERFDIVLLDINMDEVDGATLFEVVRFFHKDIKIIISSVYSINEQQARIKDADGYFDKSDDKEVLLSLVSSFITRR
ncbi:MAG: response regulator [Candidatus Omnitrophica bacterium]|nr:response regulator [Candidatus Omnitrophota bacterium]